MGGQARQGGSGSAQSLDNGSRNVSPAAASQAKYPAPSVNWSHTAIPGVANVPQPLPPYAVPPGASVRVRRAPNAGLTVYVAESRAALLNGNGTALGAFDDIAFPVDNVGKIWVMATDTTAGVIAQVFSVANGNA